MATLYQPEIKPSEGTAVTPIAYSSGDIIGTFETLGKILSSLVQDRTGVEVQATEKTDKLPPTMSEELPVPAENAQPYNMEQQAVGDWVTPEIAAFLNSIAEAEGTNIENSYNIVVGLGKEGAAPYFVDYAQHPNIIGMRTSHGPSTAAGRYQIVKQTWDDLVKKNPELTDFSPNNQDKAAWILAQRDYKTKTGRSLADDLKTGETGYLSRLKTTWVGFSIKDPAALYNKYRKNTNATNR